MRERKKNLECHYLSHRVLDTNPSESLPSTATAFTILKMTFSASAFEMQGCRDRSSLIVGPRGYFPGPEPTASVAFLISSINSQKCRFQKKNKKNRRHNELRQDVYGAMILRQSMETAEVNTVLNVSDVDCSATISSQGGRPK